MGPKLDLPFFNLPTHGILTNDQIELVMDDLPTQFTFLDNEWRKEAMKLLLRPLSEGGKARLTEVDLAKLNFRSDSQVVIKAQLDNLHAWWENKRVLRDDKAAVIGWMLSVMLTAVPNFD